MNDLQPKIKKTIYRPTNERGIRSIYDWSDRAQDYVQRKSGNRFQAYIEKNGKTNSESFGSMIEALKWRTRIKVELEKQPDFEFLSFKELFNKFTEYKKKHVTETSLGAYLTLSRHLQYFENTMVQDITSKVIDKWLEKVTSQNYLNEMNVKESRFSYIKEVKLLSQLFDHYRNYVNGHFLNPVLDRHQKDSIFNKAVYEQRKASKDSKYLTTEEIAKFLSIFRKQAQEKSLKRIYFVSALIQFRTGLRIGEVFALKWEDISWNDGVVVIGKTMQWKRNTSEAKIGNVPKNRKNRTIALIPEVLLELKNLQKEQARISGLIFSDDGFKFKAYSSVLHHYNMAFKTAEINFTATHIARHSFATDFIAVLNNQSGALQGVLGHSSQRQTGEYAKMQSKTNIMALRAYGEAKELENLRRPENEISI